MEPVTLTIDGRNVSCPSGTSIFKAAESVGIGIPSLCYHPALEPLGACRLCVVEDEKSKRLLASCVTPVAPNMVIRTDSPGIREHRKNIVRLMLANHPESCVVCSQGNRCELRKIAADLGVGEIDLYPMPLFTGLEDANPFIVRDLSKCILCGRCIRADHELVVVGAIDYHLRGFPSRPATLYDMPLERSPCTFCGTCVSMCPTGALSVKNTRYVGSAQQWASTVCGFCGVGCALVMGSVEGQVVDVRPSADKDTVNGPTLCVRGHFEHDYLRAGKRLTRPMIRKEGQWESLPWKEALEGVARRLLDIQKRHGPQSVAFLGSSKCTNEENYLFQKTARALLKTNNVDSGAYLWGGPVLDLLHERTGNGCCPVPLAGLEKAEVIVVLGADPTHSAPVAGYYVKRAAKRGVPLVVVDPRKTGLVPFSSLWLPLSPHGDLWFINALAALLRKGGDFDIPFIQEFTEGFEDYAEGLSRLDLEKMCGLAGMDRGDLERAAGLVKGKKIAFVLGHGILQQRHGALCMDALLNLALMTGSLGNEKGGVHVLARDSNQRGARDMGAAPGTLPGREPLGDGDVRKRWERAWETRISPDRGLNAFRMIEAAERGDLKALYIMGENPLRSFPQPERIRRSLERLELVVVQDIVFNETSPVADVLLAGAAFSEKAGSFTNMEGRVQLFEAVVPPPGEARPDWQILDLLGVHMGRSGAYGSLGKIRAEMTRFIPSYEALKGPGPARWIRGSWERRLFNPHGEGSPIPFTPVHGASIDSGDKEYPFTAVLGSHRCHLGSGTRTSLSERLGAFGLIGEIGVCPGDAERLGIRDGDKVRAVSRVGSIERAVSLDGSLRPGLIFVPTAFKGNEAANLIPLCALGEPEFPGWKECRVRLERT